MRSFKQSKKRQGEHLNKSLKEMETNMNKMGEAEAGKKNKKPYLSRASSYVEGKENEVKADYRGSCVANEEFYLYSLCDNQYD